jgi:fructokinase
MSHPRVLCLGELLYDLIANEPGISYENVRSWVAYPGGAPANVACALVKLGTPAGFIGSVGDDDPGHQLVHLLQNIGVNTDGIQRHPTAPTRQIYVTRTQTGDRQFVGFGDRHTSEFADTFLNCRILPTSLFEAAEYLVFGTLEMAYATTGEAIACALDLADHHHVKPVLDVNWRPMFWDDPNEAKEKIQAVLSRIDILKLSDEEAEWLFETTDPEGIAQRIDTLEGVMVTAGAHGCSYWFAGTKGHRPAFKVDVEETTGAGDSFLAGIIHQCCQRGSDGLRQPEIAREIITYASAVGALTTVRAGAIAAQPTSAEVDAFLHLQAQQS